jgi:membrane protein DedA with SNARE-associated domain
MRFRSGLVVGAAVGYVLGTRAGRQRYEQIKHWAGEARKHPAVAQLANQTVGVVDAGRFVAATVFTSVAKGLRTVDTHSSSE